ncbi:MAG TPA: DinB family protein [Candidatus Angelobacter sp.]|nr:DinB family protein [Candidatus Angelobacter sp.]
MNTECSRIAEQLAATIQGEAWYGESLRQILDGVTAEQALARPVSSAHFIWELVLHLEKWCKFFYEAVHGTPIPPWPNMPKEMDWPPVAATDEKAWQAALESLFACHLQMIEAIKNFDDDQLDATVPGRAYNFYRLFQSTTQHAVYHSAQISLLKKAL